MERGLADADAVQVRVTSFAYLFHEERKCEENRKTISVSSTVFMSVAFFIFLLSIKLGVGGWGKTDKLSLLICILSLTILFLTGNAFLALLMNLCIYVSGYIPTIKKVIENPNSESKFAWSLFFIGVILNLITVVIGADTGIAVWLYPIILVVTVGTLYFFILKPALLKR